MDKKISIVLLPSALASFMGTQEELDSLIKELVDEIKNGTIYENIEEFNFDNVEYSIPDRVLH